MTGLILTALFAITQTPSPIPLKALDSPTATGQTVTKNPKDNKAPSTQPPSSIGTSAANQQHAGSTAKSEDTQQAIRVRELPRVSITKDWSDWGVWAFNGLLVLVGAFQLLVLWRQAKIMKVQAEIMNEHAAHLKGLVAAAEDNAKAASAAAEAANKNADFSRLNAEATRDNAIAAKAGAEAAKLNAEAAKEMLELIISKERARIRVELKKLDLSVGGYLLNTVAFTVRLYGSTEARIIESGAEAYIHNSAEPAAIKSSYLTPISLEQVLTPQSPLAEKFTFLSPAMKLEKVDVDKINERKSFVHFRGFIKYKDVFERERETKFQYLWSVTDLPNFGSQGPYSFWIKCGAASDNMET